MTDDFPGIVVQPNWCPLTTAEVSAVAEEVGHTPGGVSVVDSLELRDGRASIKSGAIGSMAGVASESGSGEATSEAA